jgi:hypothetical protein
MAITCPRCGSEFDATLFQFGHRVRCRCGAEIEYPGPDQRAGHVAAQAKPDAVSGKDGGGETNTISESKPHGDEASGTSADRRPTDT